MLRLANKHLPIAEEWDAEVRNIEEKLAAEKATLETWRHSRKPLHEITQITLLTAKKNTTGALTITYVYVLGLV